MNIEVEVISEEIIKPSSQTPDPLRHYTLSSIDQISPKSYNPLVLFYKSNNSEISEISRQIKKSLSDALTLFYPLAGRVIDDKFIDCTDDGISFSEARVSSSIEISRVLETTNPSELSKLLPFDLHRLTEFPAGVRLNVFSSEGVAIGICISHQIADALSCIAFVKTWAKISRGGSIAVERPIFVSAELFPPIANLGIDASSGIRTAVVSRRFSFASPEIEAIRANYGQVSRVEALSMFILSRLVLANPNKASRERITAVIFPANIRQRLNPPLPENSFGNLYRIAIVKLGNCDAIDDDDGGEIVKRVREKIHNVDPSFERMMGLDKEMTRVSMEGGEFITYSFTSLCRFPLYDADFGWGEPIWVSSAALTFDNLVAFMDSSKDGGGIDTYVSLKEEVMAKLQVDVEFLKYVNL